METTQENLNVKMNNVRILVSYFGTQIKFRFLQSPPKGEKLDSKTATEFAERSYDFSTLPSSIFTNCECARHGLKQKMVDSLAMNKDTKAATSLDEAVKTLNTLFKQLQDGNWRSAVRVQAESVKLSDMEAQFLASVKAGVTSFEQANALYQSITGKQLPMPQAQEAEVETEEEVNENP